MTTLKPGNFEVLQTSKVVEYVQDSVQDLTNIIDLSSTMTRILLQRFQWDKLTLTDIYYSDDDKERFFKKAGIVNPFKDASTIQQPTETCEICLSSLNSETRITGTNCGHEFCRTCWLQYLTIKIMDENIGDMISCAASGCNIILDDELVMQLVTDDNVKQKYQRLITNSYVKNNQLLRWCPSPGCSYVIKVLTFPYHPLQIHCSCGHDFCFNCGEEWHAPLTCKLFTKFRTFGAKRDQMAKKFCPKCEVMIEKISGCYVMTCTSCTTKFCWVCLKLLSINHANAHSHMCTPNEDLEEDRLILDAIHEILTNLTHNGTQYYHYPTFIEKESGLGRKIDRIIQLIQDVDSHTNELESIYIVQLRISVEILYNKLPKYQQESSSLKQCLSAYETFIECHQTMKYIAIFAYFLRKSNETVIVEGNFEDLKTATKHLGECIREMIKLNHMETVPDELVSTLETVPDQLVSSYKYCQQRLRSLLEDIQEGYDNDWWSFHHI